MTTFKQKLLAALSSAAMLVSVASPAYAGTTILITGNGVESENEAEVKVENTTTVVQSNNAKVENKVDANANSGYNDANRNTGGDVVVDTGDAKSDVAVSNSLNSNSASVACCAAGDTKVVIADNGDKSENEAELKLENETELYQDNRAD